MGESSVVFDYSIEGVGFQLVFDIGGAEVFLRDPETGDLHCSKAFLTWSELDAIHRRLEIANSRHTAPRVQVEHLPQLVMTG